jgi:hypothetical protein
MDPFTVFMVTVPILAVGLIILLHILSGEEEE